MSFSPGKPGAPVECWSACIRGRVQGVGYRDSCARQAEKLGVTGWVRNRLDGSVEALLVGPPERLAQLVEWLHRGPTAARVDEVGVTQLAAPFPACDRFERRPTA